MAFPMQNICTKDFTLVKMNSYADITVIMTQNILLIYAVLQSPFLGKSENAHFIIFINTGGHVLSACAKHVN
jgi:hypothetical protein